MPCLANMFASCKKQLSFENCASLVPLGMKWACICAGNERCVWLCVGGVWLCQYVSVCDSMCLCVVFVVLLVASVLASMRWLLCGGDVSKEKTKPQITGKYPVREFFPITVLYLFEKIKSALIYSHYSFILIRKNKSAPRQICNYFRGNGSRTILRVMRSDRPDPVSADFRWVCTIWPCRSKNCATMGKRYYFQMFAQNFFVTEGTKMKFEGGREKRGWNRAKWQDTASQKQHPKF